MGTYRGTVIAAESWNAPMEEMTVPPAQDGSYEHVFDRAGGHDQFLVTDDLDDDAALGQPRGNRAIGVVYHPDRESETTCRPSFPIATTRSSTSTKTSALHPLAQHADRTHVPDLYPWGL